MAGLSSSALRPLSGLDHVRQSVAVILTTPLGSRVMRREFGSRLFELVDRPVNRQLVLDVFAATAEAVMAWEPRLDLQNVALTIARPGALELALDAVYLPAGERVRLDGIVVS